MDLTVYIGHDQREEQAAEVCRFSIRRRSAALTKFLRSADIPAFKRPREPHQSTDFTYTRFLVPYLEQFRGWSLFCDCDFLFLEDVNNLLLHMDDSKAVLVCKHPQYSPNTKLKMDGVEQHRAWRKNWASLILFNNEHPSNAQLTPDYINRVNPGIRLHQFGWLEDEEIGSLPLDWNCLDGYYHLHNPKAIHYTDGGPWFDGYKNTFYSKLWDHEYEMFTRAS